MTLIPNTNEDVYGAVVMARSLRVHPVHLMNADWAPDGRQPSNEANRLGLSVRWYRLLSSTSTIAIYWYFSARQLILIFPRKVEDWVDLSTAVWVCSPCPRLYMVIKKLLTASHTPAKHTTTLCWKKSREIRWVLIDSRAEPITSHSLSLFRRSIQH